MDPQPPTFQEQAKHLQVLSKESRHPRSLVLEHARRRFVISLNLLDQGQATLRKSGLILQRSQALLSQPTP